METHATISTPELPERNPERLAHAFLLLPPLPESQDARSLIPPPLFNNIKRAPPSPIAIRVAHTEGYNCPATISIEDLSEALSPKLPKLAHSKRSSEITPSAASISNSLSPLSQSLYVPSPAISWTPKPNRTLRRMRSPKTDTLRNLRSKESDACLQRVYDQQTFLYLRGSDFSRGKPERNLAAVFED